jgi:hypothetical protein
VKHIDLNSNIFITTAMTIEYDYPFDIESSGKSFTENDCWNNDNVLTGYICMKRGNKMGSLIITSVNGVECKQFVYATPKIHYPFDSHDIFEFPNNPTRITVYEKLDGTNICAYRYIDDKGNVCVSYKTRMLPILTPAQANFYDKMLRLHSHYGAMIKNAIIANDMNLSFEMYGAENKHGIVYQKYLDLALLFGRDDEGYIHAPYELNTPGLVTPIVVADWCDGHSARDYRGEYHKLEEHFTAQCKVQEDEAEFTATGMEGGVFYVYSVGHVGANMYKCKGDAVKDEHFKIANGIPPSSVSQAIYKTVENGQQLTIENVSQTLSEDYPPQEVMKRAIQIRRMIDNYLMDINFRTTIFNVYEEMHKADETFNIDTNKARVMQFFASKMDEWGMSRKFAGKVYTNIKGRYGASK